MTVFTSALSRLLDALWRLGSLPPTVAHEATHWLLARPVAREVRLRWRGRRHPSVAAAWRRDAPRVGIVLASIGPTILGTAMGLIALSWTLLDAGSVSGALPSTTRQWLLTSVVAVWWGIYSWPSAGDRAGARSAPDGSEHQQEDDS